MRDLLTSAVYERAGRKLSLSEGWDYGHVRMRAITAMLLAAGGFHGSAGAESAAALVFCSKELAQATGDCSAAGTTVGSKKLRLVLTAQRSAVEIGPYLVETEALNGSYVPPVLKLRPGEDFEFTLRN
jgi:hypothetical protein